MLVVLRWKLSRRVHLFLASPPGNTCQAFPLISKLVVPAESLVEIQVGVKVSAWLFIGCLCHLKGKEERKPSSKVRVRSGVLLAGMRTGLLGHGLCTNEMHLLVPKHPCAVLE